MIKLMNAKMEILRINMFDNFVQNENGGIHLVNSNLTLKNSEFFSKKDITADDYFRDADFNKLEKSRMGGFLYVSAGSQLYSEKNNYRKARSYVGGCVAIDGFSVARFYNDRF